MVGVTPEIDIFELVILALFVGALGMALYGLVDAWRNILVAIDATDPDVVLLGLEDVLRAAIVLLLLVVPGTLVGAMALTTSSPIQTTDGTPQQLVAAITLRVSLLLIAVGLFAITSLSAWLRRRMAHRRRATLTGGARGQEGGARS